MTDDTAKELLETWFGDWDERVPLPEGGPPQYDLWWKQSAEQDERLRQRFGEAHRAALAGACEAWGETPRGNLALVLLLDQVTRNLYRRQPEMFAADPAARARVRLALDRGDEGRLALIERYFLYMPLMHSEALPDHERATDRFQALLADARAAGSARIGVYEGGVEFEARHRAIVARFGRYPHRNAILGRASTPEERAFLEEPGSSFL
ncbi:MAG: DUF924 family protein [Myxococcota bacterium]